MQAQATADIIRAAKQAQSLIVREMRRQGTLAGWKLAFGSSAAMSAHGLRRPVIGYLDRRHVLPSGAEIDIHAWSDARIEPELAVRLACTPSGSDNGATCFAMEVAPAIEVINLDPPEATLAQALERNIFHKCAIVGPFRPVARAEEFRSSEMTVTSNGSYIGSINDPEKAIGSIQALIDHTAKWSSAVGCPADSGDIVITGAVMPPHRVHAGDVITLSVVPFSQVSVSFC